MHEDAADDPLAVIYTRVDLRLATSPTEGAAGHVRAAVDAYVTITAWIPDVEPTARCALAPLVTHVSKDTAEVLGLIRGDPASPGLEAAYALVLGELSDLAAVFVSRSEEYGSVPDPYDAYAEEYTRISTDIRALLAASVTARPVWMMLRPRPTAHPRRGPPPRPAPRPPLADDAEYYGGTEGTVVRQSV